MHALVTVLAQIPGVPDGMIDTTEVSPFDPLWAIVCLLVGYIVGRVARSAVRRYGGRANLPANVVDLLGTITMWTAILVATAIALSFLGFTVAPLWVFILIVLVILFVAGQPFIANFGSGILLQARAPFEPGDLVQLDESTGVVKEVNSRVVVLDTIDNRRVFIPNTSVLSNTIVNLTHRRLRMSHVVLDVEYGTDLDNACRTAEESLVGLDAILTKPAPAALVASFESSSVRIILRFWHQSDLLAEWTAVDAAARASYQAFYDKGIVFAFPQATLWWGAKQNPGDQSPGNEN
ncbi:MAG: mechanosensitive ion channel family protein [Acidimicrobiia bacterium]